MILVSFSLPLSHTHTHVYPLSLSCSPNHPPTHAHKHTNYLSLSSNFCDMMDQLFIKLQVFVSIKKLFRDKTIFSDSFSQAKKKNSSFLNIFSFPEMTEILFFLKKWGQPSGKTHLMRNGFYESSDFCHFLFKSRKSSTFDIGRRFFLPPHPWYHL